MCLQMTKMGDFLNNYHHKHQNGNQTKALLASSSAPMAYTEVQPAVAEKAHNSRRHPAAPYDSDRTFYNK